MTLLRFLFLFNLCSSSFAEHKSEPNSVYNRSSQLTVDSINKASEMLRDPTKVLSEVLNNTAAVQAATKPADSQSQLRDPTQLSGTFRQALQAFKPRHETSGSSDNETIVPNIELVGKVYIPKTAEDILNSAGSTNNAPDSSTIALKIDDDIVHLREGDMSSIIKNEHIFTIQINQIAQHHVKITLQPGNESLILH